MNDISSSPTSSSMQSEDMQSENMQPEKHYSDKSVPALVLSICGIIPMVGPICSILAIIFANSTLKGIKAGHVSPESHGKAQAALIVGIVLLCLGVVWAILLIALWASDAADSMAEAFASMLSFGLDE